MINEAQKRSLKELSKKKTPLYPFDIIETKINLLRMDIRILNNHPDEFPKEFIERLKELTTNVGDHLIFYIFQEIQDFYRQSFRRFGNTIPFPESAGALKNLRHKNIAHMNAEESSEIANLCIKLEEEYGSEKIYSDWLKFKEELYEALKEGRIKLK